MCGAGSGSDIDRRTGVFDGSSSEYQTDRCRVAEEMYQAAITAFPEADAGILCAAVADYRPDEQASEKIKRETKGEMSLRLVPNKDIAAFVRGDQA